MKVLALTIVLFVTPFNIIELLSHTQISHFLSKKTFLFLDVLLRLRVSTQSHNCIEISNNYQFDCDLLVFRLFA